MYIKSIHVRNIRGLPPIDLNLQRPDGSYAGMTVLAGPNGSGKTTLLQSLALATYGDDVNPFNNQYWLRKGQNDALVSLELLEESWDGVLNVEQGFIGLTGSSEKRPVELEEELGQKAGWFLVGYGPLRRIGKSDELAMKEALNRCQTLMMESYTLTETITWLKALNHRALEKNEQAEQLQHNLLCLLGDGLLPKGVEPIKVTSEGLIVKEDSQELVLNQLSDGYRTVVAVVMDMVRQMDQAFKGFVFEWKEDLGHGVCPHDGVVLIDEIDTHLHPNWQQSLGFWLKSRFPKIQFIVTTHSPFICQSADPNGLIRLSRDKAYLISEQTFKTVVNGSLDEAALTELFGLTHSHSQESEDLRQRLAVLDAKLYQGTITDEEGAEREKIMDSLPRAGGEVQRLLRKFSEV